jgi:hypothetical protein
MLSYMPFMTDCMKSIVDHRDLTYLTSTAEPATDEGLGGPGVETSKVKQTSELRPPKTAFKCSTPD